MPVANLTRCSAFLFEYARFDVDIRRYADLTRRDIIADRPFCRPGSGIPYGNSGVLPYTVNRFFTGGSNDLRVFVFAACGEFLRLLITN